MTWRGQLGESLFSAPKLPNLIWADEAEPAGGGGDVQKKRETRLEERTNNSFVPGNPVTGGSINLKFGCVTWRGQFGEPVFRPKVDEFWSKVDEFHPPWQMKPNLEAVMVMVAEEKAPEFTAQGLANITVRPTPYHFPGRDSLKRWVFAGVTL